MLSREAGNALDIIPSFYFFFFRGKISSFYEREVTIMTMYILALTAVAALLIQMDWMQYRDRRDNND